MQEYCIKLTSFSFYICTFISFDFIFKCTYVLSFCLFVFIDGLYLIEVDRVLRPGGYWILSGPPIHWKKHYKGWERTQEDLNAEQTNIENVAKSLCWNKVVEKDDIAIWQKPTNHLNCKVNRKLTQNPPFCPAQDPDKAWLVLFLVLQCLRHKFFTGKC